jgi:hypothetical protein
MTKRPAFGSSIENMLAKREAAPVQPLKARARRNQSKKGVASTFVMSEEMFRKFQEIKLTRATSMQGLFEEMADVWLKSIGETGFKRIED